MAGTLAAGTDTGPALPNRSLTDIERSRAFYDEIFALPVAFEVPADADDATREQLSFLYGGVIYKLGSSLLGLRPVGDDEFAEDRTGLDHVSFGVDSRSDLDAASAMLSERGIAHGDIKDIGAGYIFEFRTPTPSPSSCSRGKPDRRWCTIAQAGVAAADQFVAVGMIALCLTAPRGVDPGASPDR